MTAISTLRWRTYALLAAVMLLGYWGSAMALGESYPLSQLMMFSVPERAASRVIVRDAGGLYAEVADFEVWDCAPDLDLSGRCSPGFSPQDELAMEIVRQRRGDPGEGGRPITLVRRVFRVDAEDRSLTTEQCDLAMCIARRGSR